jgi:hypothetical protein
MTMDAETARQERIMGIRHIVRQQKELIAAKCERAASRQRGRYHHLQSYAVCVRCGENYAIPGQTLCVECALYHNQMRSGAQQAPRR